MFSKPILDKICSLPEDKQKQLIQYVSADRSSHNIIEKCQAELRAIFSQRDADLVMEVLAHLNYLHKRNTTVKFEELADELAIPIQFTRLYLLGDVIDRMPPIPFDYKWRIDTSVPKASAVLININRDDEQICFRLDVSTYHKLRFNVALLLKELTTIKRTYTRIKKF